MADLKFDIKEYIGVLSSGKSGWSKELNFVQWGEYDPKFDIREWSPDHQKMGKGVTFTVDELKELKKLLNEILD